MKAISLSGGGSSGCFEAGFLYRIFHEIEFDKISGTSVGALNSILLIQAYIENNPEVIKKAWMDIKGNKSIFSVNWFNLLRLKSPFSFKPLQDIAKQVANFDKIIGHKKQVFITSTDLISGQTIYFSNWNSSKHDFQEAILASASLPFFLPPVKIGNHMLVDGGIRENAPISKLLENKEIDEIVIVLANTFDISIKNDPPNFNNPLNTIFRMLEIFSNKVTFGDIRGIVRINEILKNNPNIFTHKRILKTNIVFPSHHIVNGTLNFDPIQIKKGFDLGIKYAEKFLEEYKTNSNEIFVTDI